EIWKRKLDWIAEHGGMALLNVHPDFMSLRQQREDAREITSAHYEGLLRYIRNRYDGGYWNALPRDVARRAAASVPRNPRHGKKRICMLTYSYYQADASVTR